MGRRQTVKSIRRNNRRSEAFNRRMDAEYPSCPICHNTGVYMSGEAIKSYARYWDGEILDVVEVEEYCSCKEGIQAKALFEWNRDREEKARLAYLASHPAENLPF